MRRSSLLAFLGALVLILAALPAVSFAGTPRPRLQIITLANGAIAVRGTHWLSRSPVIITAAAFDSLGGLQLRSTASGSFTVVVHSARACDAVVAHAYDLHGHARSAHRSTMGCNPVPRPAHMSTDLAVRQGTILSAPLIHKLSAADGDSITVRVGEMLYLWEPGAARPVYSPHADPHYLVLYQQGTSTSRICPQANCGSGFFWEWVALRPGNTGIDLAAACRAVTPPCMVPDRIYRVSIVPSSTKAPLAP